MKIDNENKVFEAKINATQKSFGGSKGKFSLRQISLIWPHPAFFNLQKHRIFCFRNLPFFLKICYFLPRFVATFFQNRSAIPV
jgi:hypothetical protein